MVPSVEVAVALWHRDTQYLPNEEVTTREREAQRHEFVHRIDCFVMYMARQESCMFRRLYMALA